MWFVQAPQKQAKHIQTELVRLHALDTDVKVERDHANTYFPVKHPVAGFSLVERDGMRIGKAKDLPAALSELLSPAERAELIGSYDLVGNIAIIDVPEQLVAKETKIAQAVLDSHKHVTTVLKKEQKHHGEFRTQSFTYLLGEDTREALVGESGCTFLVDVEQVYFSVRLSTERLRIARLITPGEAVLVMFSGAAPYVGILEKHSVAGSIVGVEKNPVGHRYALENLRRNKLTRSRVYNADCADMHFLEERFDRILLPLPASSEVFLGAALAVAKDRCVLHVYKFGKEGEVLALIGQFTEICAEHGFRVAQSSATKAGHHAPFVYRWCFDLHVQRL